MATTEGAGRVSAQAIAEAHARLLRDHSLQFSFAPPPAPASAPAWLNGLGPLLREIAPAMKVLFWGGLIVGGLLLALLVGREILRTRWPARAGRQRVSTGVSDWRPAPEAAWALLQDADRLAGEGRFAEAAHLLLLRSIDDLHGRRPDLIRPALTSRDIGGSEALPPPARPAFGTIAEIVERSLFGGRPVDAAAWRHCRQAYEAFALPEAWA